MKQYTKYITALAVLMALTVSSCEKWLDQAPTGEVSKEFIFQDYITARRYMDVLYSNRIQTFFDGNRLSNTGRGGFMESATDMAEYTANYGVANKSFNIGNWYESEVTPIEVDRWSNSYENIRRCYMFLENRHLFNNDPLNYIGTQRRKDLMKGEVHFMIAWYYSELLKRYGGVPIITKTLEFDSDFRIPRATYDETANFILAHLDTALNHPQYKVADTWSNSDYGRITRGVVMAFKSRLLLYMASPLNNPTNESSKWLAAANAARDLIDYNRVAGPGLNKYQLQPHYQNIFVRGTYPENVKEIIDPAKKSSYTITFNSVVIRNNCATPGQPFQGFGSNGPTQNFVDRFEVLVKDGGGNVIGTEPFDWNNPNHTGNNLYKNRDPRFYYTVLFNDQQWISRKLEMWRDGNNYGKDINPTIHLYTKTGYYLKKFWPRECLQAEITPGSASMTGFYSRWAEVLLNYAEAMNEVFGPDVDGLGRATPALTSRAAINQIRARLVCPPFATIPATNHPQYQVWFERQDNPDFPVLPTGIPPIPVTEDPTTDEFRERIINERMIELSFEDHYWYDILRWKLGEERIGGTIYGIDILKIGSEFVYNRVELEKRYFDPSRMYRYPIPQSEVYKMDIEQNPGWGN